MSRSFDTMSSELPPPNRCTGLTQQDGKEHVQRLDGDVHRPTLTTLARAFGRVGRKPTVQPRLVADDGTLISTVQWVDSVNVHERPHDPVDVRGWPDVCHILFDSLIETKHPVLASCLLVRKELRHSARPPRGTPSRT